MEQTSTALIPQERIESRIFVIRNKRVMLDKDLALLYEVPTGRLNEQVKRNIKRVSPRLYVPTLPKRI